LSPTDFVTPPELSGNCAGIYQMTDGVSDEQFEEAIEIAQRQVFHLEHLPTSSERRHCNAYVWTPAAATGMGDGTVRRTLAGAPNGAPAYARDDDEVVEVGVVGQLVTQLPAVARRSGRDSELCRRSGNRCRCGCVLVVVVAQPHAPRLGQGVVIRELEAVARVSTVVHFLPSATSRRTITPYPQTEMPPAPR